MITKEQKQKWIEALRSGNYKQGTHRLYHKYTDRYCCLGVLCDVLGFKKVTNGDIQRGAFCIDDIILTHCINYSNKEIIPSKLEEELIHMNDNGNSFEFIASFIESYENL